MASSRESEYSRTHEALADLPTLVFETICLGIGGVKVGETSGGSADCFGLVGLLRGRCGSGRAVPEREIFCSRPGHWRGLRLFSADNRRPTGISTDCFYGRFESGP